MVGEEASKIVLLPNKYQEFKLPSIDPAAEMRTLTKGEAGKKEGRGKVVNSSGLSHNRNMMGHTRQVQKIK